MDVTAEEAAAGAAAIARLFQHWQVTDEQACRILALSDGTWTDWKAGTVGEVSIDQATRLSLLLGIHVALQYLYSDRQHGYWWMGAPNAVFDGLTPLEAASSGSIDGIMRVRSYLEAERA